MGRLKRNWNWWPVLTFSTGLKFQLAAMATGPWKLDPDRNREKLKTATAAVNWRKVAYNCQWQALNWNNLPFPVPEKIRKREMKKNQNPKPENCVLIFFRQKSIAIQSKAHATESSTDSDVRGSSKRTCMVRREPDMHSQRSKPPRPDW